MCVCVCTTFVKKILYNFLFALLLWFAIILGTVVLDPNNNSAKEIG